jgi:hypothetical protein
MLVAEVDSPAARVVSIEVELNFLVIYLSLAVVTNLGWELALQLASLFIKTLLV